MDKLEILKQNLKARVEEIQNYQINIDNFERGIKKIDEKYLDNQKMIDFKNRLIELLEDNRTEQLKAIIIHDVIQDQIQEMEDQ